MFFAGFQVIIQGQQSLETPMGKNKKKKIAGWNNRFDSKRNTGHEGAVGANIFPQENESVVAVVDPAGNYDGGDTIPADSSAFEVEIVVTEVFNNVPTLTVGTTADPDAVVTLADAVDLTSLGTKYITREVNWPIASVVRAVLGGTPNQGAATVTVRYVI